MRQATKRRGLVVLTMALAIGLVLVVGRIRTLESEASTLADQLQVARHVAAEPCVQAKLKRALLELSSIVPPPKR